MRVLLVNPIVRTVVPPADYPYGLTLIAAILEKHDIEFDVLDINGYRYSDKQVLDFLNENSYDIIGIGGIITTYSYIKWFVNKARAIMPKAKIVVGGPVVTCKPEFMVRHLKADLIVVGEGEETFVEVIKNFDFEHKNHGKPFSGAAYLDANGKFIFQPRSPMKDLDILPLPAWHRFPMETYTTNSVYSRKAGFDLKRGVKIYTSRGCPMNCSFCYHTFGRGIRVRKLENVIEEIKILKKIYSPQFVFFMDEAFSFNRNRVMEFCDLYAKSGIDLPFRLYGRLDTVDEEMASVLAKTGCLEYGFGVESGSVKILKNMNKSITPKKMEQSIGMLRKHDLVGAATFIHGMVGENEATVNESLAFYKRAGFKNVSPLFIQPYPGAPMWTPEVEAKILKRYKSIENYFLDMDEAMNFVVNLSEVSNRKLFALRRKIVFETSGIDKTAYNYKKFLGKVKTVRNNGIFWAVKRLLKVPDRKRRQLN